MRPAGGLLSPTYSFSRWCTGTSIFNTTDGTPGGPIVTAVQPNTIAQQFITMSVVPNFTDFQALFSQYKITSLEFHLINFQFTDIVGQASGGPVLGTTPKNTAIYVGSQNDTLGFSTLAQCQQESGVVVRDYCNGGKPFIIKVGKPTYKSPGIDSSGAIVADAVDSAGWLDTAYNSIAYRGFFCGIENAYNVTGQPNTVVPLFSVRCKVNFVFRGVR